MVFKFKYHFISNMMNTISPYVNKLIDGKVLSLTLFSTKAHYWFGQVLGHFRGSPSSNYNIYVN